MNPRPARFRQADITRAVRAAQATGLKVGRIEISADGKIVIITAEDAPLAVKVELSDVERGRVKYDSPGSDYEKWKGDQKAARAAKRIARQNSTVKPF